MDKTKNNKKSGMFRTVIIDDDFLDEQLVCLNQKDMFRIHPRDEHGNTFITCKCGSEFLRGYKYKHIKTKKHQLYSKAIDNQQILIKHINH